MIGYTVDARDRKPSPNVHAAYGPVSVIQAEPRMGRHAEVLAAMREAHPTMQFKRFRLALLEAFGADPGVARLLDRFWFVPDAYFLRPEDRLVQAFEVIIWHGLDGPKLDAYRALAEAFRAAGATFEVWVVDQGGRSSQLAL